MDNKDESTLASQSQAAQPSDEQLRETDGYKLGWMEGMQEGAELATGGEKTAADVEAEFADLLPGSYYMDPPDGGSPSVLEQVSRMAEDAAQWRTHLAGQSQATRAAIEHAARICESFCACDNGEDDEEINRMLRNRAAQIHGLLAAPTAQEVTQQAAKAETAEQAEGDQANVLPPTRGTDSQRDADELVLSDVQIMNLSIKCGMGNIDYENDPVGYCNRFARAIEEKLARRFRAQGGNTNDKGSDLAPTTSTVSAPEEVRNQALKEAEEFARCYDLGTPDGHAIADAIRALRTTSGKGEAA